MQKRSLFSRIFGNDDNSAIPQTATEFKLLDNEKAIFTTYSGDYKKEPDVLACVDAIARNGAKLHPRHIRNYKREGVEKLEIVKDDLYKLLAKQPNELQNAYKFYYQIITELELNNNAIIYVSKDKDLKVLGLYPLKFNECKFYEYQDNLFVKFKFGRSKERFVPYANCIHLTKGDSKDGIFGGSIEPLKKVLSMKHILDEGIINAIRTTQSIKGVIKSSKAMLKPEDVKKMRDQFVQDFISNGDKSGIGGLDATTDFTPVKIEPTIASAEQTKQIDEKVLKYFGINEKIITSSYSENEWNAFYESILEPIALQMSLEFTNKLFTPTEKGFGNEILFESNRLQYASNNTKIELVRYCGNIMTINEQREVFNLSPIEGGDVFMIDQNHEINEDVSNIDNNISNDNQANTRNNTYNEFKGNPNHDGKTGRFTTGSGNSNSSSSNKDSNGSGNSSSNKDSDTKNNRYKNVVQGKDLSNTDISDDVNEIIKAQGFDGKPILIKDKKEFEELLENDTVGMYRGVNGGSKEKIKEYSNMLRTGEFKPNNDNNYVSGRGLYTAAYKPNDTAAKNRSRELAEKYAGFRSMFAKPGTNVDYKDTGKVERFTFTKDIKIYTPNENERILKDYEIAKKGYDAYYDRSKENVIILNRTKMIILDEED